jgi:hypothetical protein
MYRHLAVAVFIAGTLAACGGVTSPSNNTQETHTDTLKPGVGAFFSYNFTVANTGELTIAITSLTPGVSTSTVFSVGYGIPQSNGCSPINFNTVATVGFPAISGTQITKGSYCAFIQDEGLITVPETFTLTVSHP